MFKILHRKEVTSKPDKVGNSQQVGGRELANSEHSQPLKIKKEMGSI